MVPKIRKDFEWVLNFPLKKIVVDIAVMIGGLSYPAEVCLVELLSSRRRMYIVNHAMP